MAMISTQKPSTTTTTNSLSLRHHGKSRPSNSCDPLLSRPTTGQDTQHRRYGKWQTWLQNSVAARAEATVSGTRLLRCQRQLSLLSDDTESVALQQEHQFLMIQERKKRQQEQHRFRPRQFLRRKKQQQQQRQQQKSSRNQVGPDCELKGRTVSTIVAEKMAERTKFSVHSGSNAKVQ